MISTQYCIILRTTCHKLKNSLQRCMIQNMQFSVSSLRRHQQSSPAPFGQPQRLVPQIDHTETTKVKLTNEIQEKKKRILWVDDTSNSTIEEKQLSLTHDNEDDETLRPFDPNVDDLSFIGPYELPSFNFAKYINESPMLQELVKLGVDLHRIEKNPSAMQFLLPLDFDQHIRPYIQFYYDCGIPVDSIGELFNKNIFILQQDMDDLHTRIRYLRAHNFSRQMIQTIISKNPSWLNFNTQVIDRRLGYFQTQLKLNGSEVRLGCVKAPKIATFKFLRVQEQTFAIKEEMGFDEAEIKQLFVKAPKLWIRNRSSIVETFDFAHNQMGLSHQMIVCEPHILHCKKNRLEKRHKFLVELKRAQYDPSKPLYVSPKTIVSGTDAEFCTNVAKTTVATYNMFLKTF